MKSTRNITALDKTRAENIRRLFAMRKNATGLTQEDLADLLGISPGAVSQYLNGRMKVSLAAVISFCYALKCEPREISPELTLETALSKEEAELLEAYRKSDLGGKRLILSAAALAPVHTKLTRD
jgi:transcriptional regulator with XRE-family HTH domain